MKKVFCRPKSMTGNVFHYCAGCGHSITHRLIAEVIDELDIRGITIGVPPAGCAVLAYNYFNFDMIEAQHGRGPATATGLKRVLPDRVVFSYQGDGDLAAIGIAESFHAANRGENITVIFINNAVYGMTGGQMAPTSMLGQKTTTSPAGRAALLDGHPIQISEAFALLPGTAYIERCTVNSPAAIVKAKKSIRKAFQYQIDCRGFSLVEILSACPTNWKMTPIEASRWIDDVMSKKFPLGVLKDLPVGEATKGGEDAMMVKTIFAGFGGQGVLMMGFTLAHGAMTAGYNVTFLPAYGAEVRGGTANCTVAVSDEEIASPIASKPEYLVVLNAPSLLTFQNRVAPGGYLFLNSSIIVVDSSRHDVGIIKVPSSEIAEKLGNPRTANTVMMGVFLKKTGLVPPDTYLQSLAEVMGSKKKSIIEINRKAFSAGFEFLEEST